MRTLARRGALVVFAGVLVVSTAANAALPTWGQTRLWLPVDHAGVEDHSPVDSSGENPP